MLLLGVGSAVIDNVPLVAASLGMFTEALDDELWHFIAYSAGTGGSMLNYRVCSWSCSYGNGKN